MELPSDRACHARSLPLRWAHRSGLLSLSLGPAVTLPQLALWVLQKRFSVSGMWASRPASRHQGAFVHEVRMMRSGRWEGKVRTVRKCVAHRVLGPAAWRLFACVLT